MASTAITIAKFNGSNYKQWSGEMALLLEQKQVYGIIEGYDEKPGVPGDGATEKQREVYREWMKHHGIARSTILLGMEPRLQSEYVDIRDAKELWETLASSYRKKLELNVFDIREDLYNMKLEGSGSIDSYAFAVNQKVIDYNLCAAPGAKRPEPGLAQEPVSTALVDAIPKMSQQEHVFFLLCGLPRNEDWKVFIEIMRDKDGTISMKPEDVVTKLLAQEAAIKRDKGLAPETLLFAKKSSTHGDGQESRRAWRDKICFYCQKKGHVMDVCKSKKRGDPPAPKPETAAAVTPSADGSHTMTIENYWMAGDPSGHLSALDWVVDGGCTRHLCGRRELFVSYTPYVTKQKKVRGFNGKEWFAAGYGNVRLMARLPDGETAVIILQDAIHLPGTFNLISQSVLMDKDVKVESINHYGLNLYSPNGKLIATAPQIGGLFVLDLELGNSQPPRDAGVVGTYEDVAGIVALRAVGHGSSAEASRLILWHRRLAHLGLKGLEKLPLVAIDVPRLHGMCECDNCVKCKLARKPFMPTTLHATQRLELVHSDICGPLETAIGGGRYMLLFIDDATRHTDQYILKNKSEALQRFQEWKALRERESGLLVKHLRTDGGGEYTSMRFATYLREEGIMKETTTPYTPQSNGVVERAN